MKIVYEDNHIIVVRKDVGEIVQGDKTGDEPLVDTVRRYIKETYAKPGNVFCGVTHRPHRPVARAVALAKTPQALSRLNEMFRDGKVHKTYWAISRNRPPKDADELSGWITTVEKSNKSFISLSPKPGAKEARLRYRLLASSERYHLIEVELLTGRKHQIRVQLASVGCPIRGDLKYGDKRSNPDGGISLLARHIEFIHPVSKKQISLTAEVPDDKLWHALEQAASENSSHNETSAPTD